MKQVSLREKLSLLVNFTATSLLLPGLLVPLGIYSATVLRLSPETGLILLTAAILVGICSDLGTGLLCDRLQRTSRILALRLLVPAGTVLSFLTVILLTRLSLLPEGAQRVTFALTILVMVAGLSLIRVPLLSLLPSLSLEDRVRDRLCTLPRAGMLIGPCLGLLPFLHAMYGEYLTPVHFPIYQYLLTAGLCFALCTLLSYVGLWSRFNATRVKSAQPLNFLKALKANRPLKVLLVILFAQAVAIALTLTAVGTAHPHWPLLNSRLYVLCLVIQLTALWALPSLNRLLSRRLTFAFSCLGLALAALGLIVASPSGTLSTMFFLAFWFLFCLCAALSLSHGAVMLSDCVDYGQFKTASRHGAACFALYAILGKLCALICVIALLSAVLAVPALDESLLPTAFFTLNTHYPTHPLWLTVAALCALCMLYLYRRSYPLDNDFFKGSLNTLEEVRTDGENSADPTPVVRYALDPHTVLYYPDPEALTLEEAVRELTLTLERGGILSEGSQFYRSLLKRLNDGPCGIAEGIAFPHLKSPLVLRPAIALAVLKHPLNCGASDGRHCDLIFLIASPLNATLHLNLLGKLSLMLNEDGFADTLRQAGSAEEIYERLVRHSMNLCAMHGEEK